MPSNNPNTTPFTNLRSLVNQEEDRTHQYARRVRISREIARELVVMDADDWHAAGRGFFEMNECRRIANIFLREGEEALNGMSFSIIGPVFSVATELNTPDIEILDGIPFSDSTE